MVKNSRMKFLKAPTRITWVNKEPVVMNCDTSSYWGKFMPKGTILNVVGNHTTTHGGYVLCTDGEHNYLVIDIHINHISEQML